MIIADRHVLTGKGRAVVLLRQVEREWDGMDPDRQARCSALLGQLAAALRAEGQRRPTARVRMVRFA